MIDELISDKRNHFKHRPPVAVLPLGTGNDLSRFLGWGASTSSSIVDVKDILDDLAWRSTVESLDRWKITISSFDVPECFAVAIPSAKVV